jgi:hypothetical protein
MFAGSMLIAGLAASEPAHAAGRLADAVVVKYQIPAGAPTGEVQVLSLGVAELLVPSLIGTERFVHMRIAAFNRQDERAWELDAREQSLQLPDRTAAEPRFAEANGKPGPARLTLRRGERGYLDLFFAVEDDLHPSLTLLGWLVRRGQGAVAATTVFERLPMPAERYGHYRPAQYGGGELAIGYSWCSPIWGDGWLRWYAPYGRYRYHPQREGYDVSDGHTMWRYRPQPPVIAETVGDRWRTSAPEPRAEVAPAAPPSGAGPAGEHARIPARDGHAWRVRMYHALPALDADAPAPGGLSGARAWREVPLPSYGSPSHGSSSSGGSSSEGSSSSSTPPVSPLPDDPSPPASSPSSSDSVGSRWRDN